MLQKICHYIYISCMSFGLGCVIGGVFTTIVTYYI